MANEVDILDIIANDTFTGALPPELAASFGTLLLILKTAGIIFIAYILFLIVTSVMNIIRGRRIKKILDKVNEMDEKLDKVLHKGHKKEESSEKETNSKKEEKKK